MLSAPTLSHRLRDIEGSPTLALAAKAMALAQSGKAVVNFAAGEPDFPTPEPIKAAGIRAIEQNQTRYTPVAGIPELRKAVVDQANAWRGTRYEPDQAIITCGAKHALFSALQVLCEPDDEVIILSPYWVSYPALVRLACAKPVIIPMSEAEGFQPDPTAVAKAVTARTKVLILNSPSNPTGAVFDRDCLKAIGKIVEERGLTLISDEIYDQLVYAPAEHVSILQVAPGLVDQTVIVDGVSKSYSMTGWRIGYAFGSKSVIGAMSRLQSHSTSNASSISQHAALAAVTGGPEAVSAMCRQFQQRRDRLIEGLNAIEGLKVTVPDGAFYAWCNVSALGKPDEISKRWLEEALVVTVPGEAFGSQEHVRFSFATSMDQIEEGLRRLREWAAKG